MPLDTAAKPLFRDPVFDGAADPVVVWNRGERSWWIVYTNRRASIAPSLGTEWMHGTDLGVASSDDGGASWLYRGVLTGLDREWGRNTFWAPEIVDDGEQYHMYVSWIRGVPDSWYGREREIRHYTSPDLLDWRFESTLELSSSRVIDAAVHARPDGGWRMWFKDEADDSHTWAADSEDLHAWTVTGPAVTISQHEGPNVFRLADAYWMIVDEWHGQRLLRSDDLEHWEPQGLLLDAPGAGEDDASPGLHADVVVRGDDALIFYFTHPGRIGRTPPVDYEQRRTSLQVARLVPSGRTLVCDRDALVPVPMLPVPPVGDPHVR